MGREKRKDSRALRAPVAPRTPPSRCTAAADGSPTHGAAHSLAALCAARIAFLASLEGEQNVLLLCATFRRHTSALLGDAAAAPTSLLLLPRGG